MSDKNGVKRICSFCVSNWHLVTMLMPYISKKIKNENIKIITEYDLNDIANQFLSHIKLDEMVKTKLNNIKWNKVLSKYDDIKETLEKNIENLNYLNIIIYGSQEYINSVNEIISKWMKKSKKQLENIKIQIIDAYEVMQFSNNLNEILDKHDKILNTSGEREICEVFDGYKKIV